MIKLKFPREFKLSAWHVEAFNLNNGHWCTPGEQCSCTCSCCALCSSYYDELEGITAELKQDFFADYAAERGYEVTRKGFVRHCGKNYRRDIVKIGE